MNWRIESMARRQSHVLSAKYVCMVAVVVTFLIGLELPQVYTRSGIEVGQEEQCGQNGDLCAVSNQQSGQGKYYDLGQGSDRKERVKEMMQELMLESASHSLDGACNIGTNLDSVPVRAMIAVGKTNVPLNLGPDQMKENIKSRLNSVWDADRISVSEQDHHHSFITYDANDNIIAKYPILSFELLDHLVHSHEFYIHP